MIPAARLDDWQDYTDPEIGDGGGDDGTCDLAAFVLILAMNVDRQGPLLMAAFQKALRATVDEYYSDVDTEPEHLKADNDA